MSRLEELIKEYCSDGVEYKEINDLCSVTRGRVISKQDLEKNKGTYPVYSSQTINQGIIGYIDIFDYEGEYVTWTTDGAYAGTIFYRKGKFSITNICGLLSIKDNTNLSAKYLSYILQITTKQYVNPSMGNPKLMSNVMQKIKIPVPPIKVQEEIVKILDNFTNLTAELEAELENRKKQYEYYRNKLLTFKEFKKA